MSEWRFWLRLAALGAATGVLAFALVLRLSIKGGTVTMPDLKGLTQQAAEIKLHNLGLDLQVREERYSDAPYGAVLEQSLEPKAQLKRGRTIAVVVSIGNKVLGVPSVIGVPSSRQARLLLEQNGLSVGRLSFIHSDEPQDTVLAQSPEPGGQALRGEGVSLLVSDGPRPAQRLMPDLRGRALDDVRALLGRIGLVLRRVSEVQGSQASPGSVVDQSLTPSTLVESGAELALDVAPGGSAASPARLASLSYDMPEDGVQERRLRIVIKDSMGQRVVHNKMEQPAAKIRFDVQVHGTATAEISVGGDVVENREIP